MIRRVVILALRRLDMQKHNIFDNQDILKVSNKKVLKDYFKLRADDYCKEIGIEDKQQQRVFKAVCPHIMYDYLVYKEK